MNSLNSSLNLASVVIVGDIILDRYWDGEVARVSPEAPVPVVLIGRTEEQPGGAGNIAMNVTALGAKAVLVASCGTDRAADTIVDRLGLAGVGCLLQRQSRLVTPVKVRVSSRHQQLIVVDLDDIGVVAAPDMEQLGAALKAGDILLISDLGYGSFGDMQPFISAARRAGKPVLVDARGGAYDKCAGATILSVNFSEFESTMGHCSSNGVIEHRARELMRQLDIAAMLIKRDEHGMMLVDRAAGVTHFSASVDEVIDRTGVDDTIVAVVACAMAVGKDVTTAIHLANVAAGIVLAKPGCACTSISEMCAALEKNKMYSAGGMSNKASGVAGIFQDMAAIGTNHGPISGVREAKFNAPQLVMGRK